MSVRIADLYASVGLKFDTKSLNSFMSRLNAVQSRLQNIARLAATANATITGGIRQQIAGEQLLAAQARREAAQIRRDAARARQIAAQERQARSAHVAGSRGGATARVGTSGMSLGAMIPEGMLPAVGAGFFLQSFVKTQVALDKAYAGLFAMEGGAEGAKQQLQWLVQEAVKLKVPIEVAATEYAKFAATTSALGADTGTTNQLYSNVMQISSALGMSQDDTEGMTRALIQMMSKGKLMSEELKGQLAERVPGAVKHMSKALNMSISQLFDKMEKGQISGADATVKFLEYMRQAVNESGQLAAAQDGMQASINNLSNAFTVLKMTLKDLGLGDAIIGGMNLLSDVMFILAHYLPDIISWIKQLAFEFKLLLVAIVPVGGALALAFAIFMSGGLYGALGRVVVALYSMAAASWAAVAPWLPMIGMVLLFASVFAASFLLTKLIMENWGDIVLWLTGLINDLWSAWSNLINETLGGKHLGALLSQGIEFVATRGQMLPGSTSPLAGLLPSQAGGVSGGISNTNNTGAHIQTQNVYLQNEQAARGFVNNGMQNASAHATGVN